jgi:PAS domain S-box-containing protein
MIMDSPTILVVDDREENRYFLESLLTGHGFDVRLAGDGAEALAQLKAGGIDLIVSDILMPVMDGFQLCQIIRADESLRHIPIIIYTATYTGPKDEELAIKIGADRFIVKPCEPDEFMKAVREVLVTAKSNAATTPAPVGEEEVLKLYNERLVRKLEQKMLQLEQEVQAREQEEDELRVALGRLESIVGANIFGMVSRTTAGGISEVNEYFLNLIGFSREELARKPLDWAALTPPEWRQTEAQALRELHDQGSCAPYEKEYLRRDGTRVPVLQVDTTLPGIPGEYTSFVLDMTEITHLTAKLRDSQRRQQALLDSMPDIAWLKDNQSRFINVNQALASSVSLTPDQVAGKTDFDLYPQELAHAYQVDDQLVMRSDQPKRVEERYQGTDGKETWLETIKIPIKNELNEVIGTAGIARDISERKRAEFDLLRLNRALKMISECNQVLVRVPDEIELIREICRLVVQFGAYKLAWVGYARDDIIKSVEPMAWAGKDADFLTQATFTWEDSGNGQGPVGTSIRERRVVDVQNIQTDPNHLPCLETAFQRGYSSVISLPLIESGHAFGALVIFSSLSNAFDKNELRLLEELADDLTYGISALRTRHQHEQAMREIEALARFPNENPNPVLRISRNGDLLYANDASAPMLEADHLVVGQPVGEAWLARVEAAFSRDSFFKLEATYGVQTFSVSITPFVMAGYANIYALDITEREQAKEALGVSESRYRRLFEAARDGILILSAETGQVVDVNPYMVELVGYPREYFLGKELWEIGFFKDIAASKDAFHTLRETGYARYEDIPLKAHDGRVVDVEFVSNTYIVDHDRVVQCNIRDISERKQIERERVASLQRQQGISKLQQLLLIPATLNEKLRAVTDSIVQLFDADFCRIWLIQPGDLCEEGCIHAAAQGGTHVCRDRDHCLHLMSSSGRYTHIDGAGHCRVPFGYYKIGLIAAGVEYKLITNDVQSDPHVHNHDWARELGLVSFAGFQLRIPGGEILGVLALFAKHPILPDEEALLDGLSSTVARVTTQTMAEEALLRSETRFRALYETTSDAVMLLGEHGFVDCNEATLKIFGCRDKAEFYTQQPATLSPATQPNGTSSVDLAHQRVAEAINQGSARFEWLHQRLDTGNVFPAEVLLNRMELDGQVIVQATVRDISQRMQAEQERILLHTAIHQASEMVVITDPGGVIQYVNPAFERITEYSAAEAIGKTPRILNSGVQNREFYKLMWDDILAGKVWHGRFSNRRKGGQIYQEDCSIAPVLDSTGQIRAFVALRRDISDEIRNELELRQGQKLEAIGQLAAGIAHEINTPMQYVNDNTVFLKESVGSVLRYAEMLETLRHQAAQGQVDEETLKQSTQFASQVEIDYLVKEIPLALDQTLEGIGRVTKIVRAMKDFSHPGLDTKSNVDLNRMIESTITVARNEWKYVAEVHTELDPNLPLVMCFPGDINQVILNLLTNAAHAINGSPASQPNSKGLITITTKQEGGFIEIRIADTGGGMPETIRDRVFEPFFTTKEVGIGTGQGLAIAHAAIVERHKGRISFETELGKGTTFLIQLPISSTV